MRIDPLQAKLTELNDESLLECIRNGNMNAFDILFERHSRRAVELATTIIEDHFEAEEIVSDVFLSFWARREHLPQIPLFQPYLFTAIRYRARTMIQLKKTRARIVSLDDYTALPKDSPVDPCRQLQSGEFAITLHAAIEQLPPQRKLIFKLKRIDGLSYKAIATLLGISESTVKNQLVIALKSLRNYLSAHPLHLPVILWLSLPFYL